MNSRYTVLLVEDDTDIASVMVSLLESQGYRVRVAGDVATAQREIASARPDLILLDLGLPDGDGCLLYTSPSPRDRTRSRMPSSA